jgi:FtsP/CotA-like multicopper oxidase with cupredoxin domain
MNTSIYLTLKQFIRFVSLFIGTGFIAGSIVHFGEGVTVWDVSVLIIGILLFVSASFVEKYNKQISNPIGFSLFIVQSLLLAIGIGMASGGTQHFVDTPTYASVLIPLGLWIGLFAFLWREKIQLTNIKWITIIGIATATAVIVWLALGQFNTMLPESLREGHGSHGHGDSHTNNHDDNVTQGEQEMADMMGISIEELRNQTPEQHMKAMEELMNNNHTDEHGFLPAKDIDITTLPPVQPTEVLQVNDGDTITLNPTIVRKEINGKQFAMYGYNNQIPGPVIKASQGAEITVNVANKIDMETTIHWHGLRLENSNDGVPNLTQPVITPNDTYTYTIKMPDEGVYWYHPHVREDIQQDMGLYGNILVKPTNKDAYNPVNTEETLIIDDLFIGTSGEPVPYGEHDILENGKEDVNYSLMGRFGNVMLVNGEPDFTFNTTKGAVHRFYITNVANTRTFNLEIPGAKLKRVGGDSGRYEREVFVDSVIIAPAERTVLEVYFPESGTFILQSNAHNIRELASFEVADELVEVSYKDVFNTLKSNLDVIAEIDTFREYFDKPVDKELVLDIEMFGPMAAMDHSGMGHHDNGDETLAGIEWEDEMAAMNTAMKADELDWNLVDKATGNKNMDINWQFAKGDIVKIRIVNDPDSAHPMQHPIHLHGQRFLVLEEDGIRNDNFVWKDTVLVPTGSTTDILVEMSNPGSWMIHCHIAEHLTNGMMGMFTVSE